MQFRTVSINYFRLTYSRGSFTVSIVSKYKTYLMRYLMGHDDGHPLFIGGRGLRRVEQHVGLPEWDQAPVFHGSRHEVRDGYQIL